MLSFIISGFCAIQTGSNFPKLSNGKLPAHAKMTIALGELVVSTAMLLAAALLFL